MKMDFAPTYHRAEVLVDLRAVRCNVSELKGRRSVPIDFKLSREVIRKSDWSAQPGDKFTLSLDEDGSWHFTRAVDTPGYTLRKPGAKTARTNCLQLRINVTPTQASQIFAGKEQLEYEFLGAENDTAIFVPKTAMRFAPRR